ncbi:DNA primase large subunit isoform 1 [Schistosoma japonicum]|uniref:DNA primase large subunit n=2 Tax=Schistosoma japonicum TaxID=6182 RepID=A0A4Z2CMN7_SCHJA|nr:DNA primase large subunit [Schistosoma japonicum]KAH8864474.1 DNA primase large subunit [Schistosoma japonicum]KAH8864475.1 DNA primase large subunit [Schistosoma japonicum]KAH8864476.1 DNA primase large subunit [Schistosoma japonicum]KAH8864477.1 DNA primase large subunit [Schistosoma japonicum]
MEFKSPAVSKHKLIRLQFYSCPPSQTIELSELEDYAVHRIRVLKCVETVGQDCIRGTKDYDDKIIAELGKIGGFGKIFTSCSSSLKNAKEDIHKDIISHFILQVAYCRSEDLRRWFVQQEVDLFRFRFLNERNNSVSGPEIISRFLHENHLNFTPISDTERINLQRYLVAGTATTGVDHNTTAFYKVHFTKVPDLVRSRRVFVQGGYAFVPEPDLVSLVVSCFRTSLSRNLSHLGLTLCSRIACEENRILPLLSTLSNRYLGEDYSAKAPVTGAIKADDIDGFAKQPGLFPPCMAQLHEALKAHHHLRHAGRMQYGLFLKGIGLPLEESLKFWRKAFSPKCDNDQFNKAYAYNIRHNYGKEGKRADYTPYSCIKIISGSAPGAGDYHGCPFRHMDPELLQQRLLSGGRLSSEVAETIVQRAKERLYHLSCREYLRGMLKLSVDDISGVTIHHPNQYFEEARKLSQSNKNNSSADKIHVKKVMMYSDSDDYRLLQTIDLSDASFAPTINNDDSLK